MKHAPFTPVASFEQIFAYRPDNAETYLSSPLLNAVASVLYDTTVIRCKDIADILCVDERYLSHALIIELGMSLFDLLHKYRIEQIHQYIIDNPEKNLDQVAEAIGYSSRVSLWRFCQRKTGMTPLGEISNAGEELWLKWRKKS